MLIDPWRFQVLKIADELLNHLYNKSESTRISDVKSSLDECARPNDVGLSCLTCISIISLTPALAAQSSKLW